VRLVEIWRGLHLGPSNADAMDERLHQERLEPGTRAQRHHRAPIEELPDGTFVLRSGGAYLVLGPSLLRWTNAGYAERASRPAGGIATVITPPTLVGVLGAERAPVVPFLHPTAFEA
jgi:hypothetical protein